MLPDMQPVRFTVGDDEFRHLKLNAKDEFHCARRVAPLVKGAGLFVTALATGKSEEGSDLDSLASFAEGAAPLLKALSTLTDDDADFVMARCLGVTEARDGECWAPTWDPAGRTVALPQLRMNHILRICYQVLREAITVFFSQAQSSLTELGLLAPTTAR